MSDDAATIAGFLQGSDQSHQQVDVWIHEVLRRWQPPLGDESKDIAQEVRRKLLISFRGERFDGDASLRTYVWRAAQRAAIDRLRARRRKPEISFDDVPEPPSALPGPASELETRQRRAVLARVMERLGEECRRLLALIVYEELPYAVIADREATSEGSIKVRALRCRRRASEIYRELVTSPPGERQ